MDRLSDQEILDLVRKSNTWLNISDSDGIMSDSDGEEAIDTVRGIGADRKNVVALFDGGHGRIGRIYVIHDLCDVCSETKLTIAIESSEDEYGEGKICLDCATSALQK